MQGLKEAIVKGANEIETAEPITGERFALLIESHHTDGAYALASIEVAPNVGPPLHVHHDADEVLYVLDGKVDFVCGEKRLRAGPGGFIAIPRGTPHTFRNLTDQTAKLLAFLSPGGFDKFARAMIGRPQTDVHLLAAEFAIEFVGPQIPLPTDTFETAF